MMSNVFVGNSIIGNFTPHGEIENIASSTIEKHNDCLYFIQSKKRIQLEPMNQDAKMVVINFSDEIGQLNESIYSLSLSDGNLIVVLYVYNDVQRFLLPSQSITIHLRREIEKVICSDDGYRKITLDSEDEIIPFLTDTFINNNSIFVHLESKTKKGFQMFGNGYRANVQMERPGIYVMDFYKTQNKEWFYSLTQIFGNGNIKFALWNDAIALEGNAVINLQSVRTSDVFRAWNEYMDFERQIYEEKLQDSTIIAYDSISIDGDNLIFKVSNDNSITLSENTEYEFISSFGLQGGGTVPRSVQAIIEYKSNPKNMSLYIGKCLNDYSIEGGIAFEIPNKYFRAEMQHAPGIIYVSDHSMQVEQRRRKKVISVIESKKNESSNIIMKLSNPEVVDSQLGTDYEPIRPEVLKKMFGNPNIQVKETYRAAMSMALNTPDIALIQGPPGTGKTTLIKGLIARINMMGQNFKILVSSEQHEALFNVVEKLSQNKLIPPFISSKKFGSISEDEDDVVRFQRNTRDFQTNFINVCRDIMRDGKETNSFSSGITEFVFIIQSIREKSYSTNFIATVIDKLKSIIIELGYYGSVSSLIIGIESMIRLPQSIDDIDELDTKTKYIIRKIESQRLDYDVFINDDGERQLRDLQRLLVDEYAEYHMSNDLFDSLMSGSDDTVKAAFEEYVAYTISLKDKFEPKETNEFEDASFNVKDAIEQLSDAVSKLSQNKRKSFYEIVESLCFRLNDIDCSSEIIKTYTSVIGSTCAQAEKSLSLVELEQERYDYVIIDEAGRANPLDIMIPIMLGVKVILIGDQKQLPHYIETDYVKRFEHEGEKYQEFNKDLLTKSFFQILYENLEKAYSEGRLKYKRTVQIDEQYRMAPLIGNFISSEFYNGTISNGEKTINNINDYHMFDGRNVVWLQVPIFFGMERRVHQSLERESEADRIISSIRQLVGHNEGRKLNIGIISFYKGQVDLIRQKLKDNFPSSFVNECVSCDTVDSYQGKEFDIVFVSGVRSNSYQTAEKSLGFIHFSASRINVALSRARKLLIMVADADTYKKTEHMANFISYVKKEGYYE